jgi:phosphatidate cytidylyltransferase
MEHVTHPPRSAPASSTQRVVTAALGAPVILAGTFLLSGAWFFLFAAVFLVWAAHEYLDVVRPRAPHAPLPVLLPLVPLAAMVMILPVDPYREQQLLLGFGTLLSVGIGSLVLFSRAPLQETLESLGIFAFGLPYFAVPLACIYLLQRADPWLVFLLLAIVWLGDTAAFYVGSRFGRHRLAPAISPGKTWEGAAAGFLAGVGAAAVWGAWRLGRLSPWLLVVAAATAVAAQAGDLVESMLKRSVGVKDSGHLLPGHGGLLDRCDALLFAAPVLQLGAWLVLPRLLAGVAVH